MAPLYDLYAGEHDFEQYHNKKNAVIAQQIPLASRDVISVASHHEYGSGLVYGSRHQVILKADAKSDPCIELPCVGSVTQTTFNARGDQIAIGGMAPAIYHNPHHRTSRISSGLQSARKKSPAPRKKSPARKLQVFCARKHLMKFRTTNPYGEDGNYDWGSCNKGGHSGYCGVRLSNVGFFHCDECQADCCQFCSGQEKRERKKSPRRRSRSPTINKVQPSKFLIHAFGSRDPIKAIRFAYREDLSTDLAELLGKTKRRKSVTKAGGKKKKRSKKGEPKRVTNSTRKLTQEAKENKQEKKTVTEVDTESKLDESGNAATGEKDDFTITTETPVPVAMEKLKRAHAKSRIDPEQYEIIMELFQSSSAEDMQEAYERIEFAMMPIEVVPPPSEEKQDLPESTPSPQPVKEKKPSKPEVVRTELLAMCSKGSIRCYDVTDASNILSNFRFDFGCSSLAISGDGRILFTGGGSQYPDGICAWDSLTGKMLYRMGHAENTRNSGRKESSVYKITRVSHLLTYGKNCLLSAQQEVSCYSIRLWDIKKRSCEAVWNMQGWELSHLAISPCGAYAASSLHTHQGAMISVWDVYPQIDAVENTGRPESALMQELRTLGAVLRQYFPDVLCPYIFAYAQVSFTCVRCKKKNCMRELEAMDDAFLRYQECRVHPGKLNDNKWSCCLSYQGMTGTKVLGCSFGCHERQELYSKNKIPKA